jgi:predicted metal-dependent phosphoesterase TrpH
VPAPAPGPLPRFDLQSHSTRSDGALEPAEVVAAAARAGVRLLALTDHDTLAGVAEALRAGAEHGVSVVPAIEISSIDASRASGEPSRGTSRESGESGGEPSRDSGESGGELSRDSGESGRDSGGPGGGTSRDSGESGVGSGGGEPSRDSGESDGSGGTGGASGGADVDGAGRPRELHILGYAIDHTDARLLATLERFLADREQRTLRMAENLRGVGFALDTSAIDARIAAGQPIGRPHLAEAVLSHPANAERLRSESIDDVGSLIRGYLIEGKPAYALRETPTVAEAIDAIHAAGGVAVWAHPFWDVEEPDEVLAMIDRFRALGVDGVEAFYVTHTREQTELLAKRCQELGLLSTGSADFHGPENRLFSRFMAFETYGIEPNLGRIYEAAASR